MEYLPTASASSSRTATAIWSTIPVAIVYGFEADAKGAINDKNNLVPIRIPDDPERCRNKAFNSDMDDLVPMVRWWASMTRTYRIPVGKIAVASVRESPSGLEQNNGYLYKIGANAGTVKGMETTSATGTIQSNFLRDVRSVDWASDIATMITTQRGYHRRIRRSSPSLTRCSSRTRKHEEIIITTDRGACCVRASHHTIRL